jgi:rhodanese-related sulfurtransferase
MFMENTLKIFLILLAVISTRCLDDSGVPAEDIVLDDTAKILRYIESTGDFANTDLAPALVSASELFNNRAQYFILDIRTPEEYSAGHIEFAVNISSANLYQVVDSLYTNFPFKKIVVVSKNGQASSYFTCLLRLAEFPNVYTLNYGMASWNIDFANEWFAALANSDETYTNTEYPKLAYNNLPRLEFPSSLKSEEERTPYRIKEIIGKGFISGINYSENLSTSASNNNFLVCYGQPGLYGAPRDLGSRGHPKDAVWFRDASLYEFRSVNSLQTLPHDQSILIYSGDGQLSACMVAYLTFLGYDVKTLLFGANHLFYWRLNTDPRLVDYVFSTDDIMNYPYVSGN